MMKLSRRALVGTIPLAFVTMTLGAAASGLRVHHGTRRTNSAR